MSTWRICRLCGDLHDVADWPGNHREAPPARSDLAAPMVLSDSLEGYGLNGVKSMADGRHYTSKARLRADYRARGMVEMGNDKPKPFRKPKPDRKAIKAAVRRAASQAGLGA